MRKTVTIFLLALLFAVLSPTAFSETDSPQTNSKDVLVLPSSLERVETKAFEGTAARIVIFPEGLQFIGDSVFAGSRHLTEVYIPLSVEKIGQNAFSSSKKLTIKGVIGSLAEKWAKEHQIPFVSSNIWNAISDNTNADDTNRSPMDSFHQAVKTEIANNLRKRSADEGKSMRPQERPELNPIDYRFP